MFIYLHVCNLKERKMCWEPTTLLNKKSPYRRIQRKTNQQLTRYVLLFALKLLCSPTKEGNNVALYHTLCFVWTTTRKGVMLTKLHYRKFTYGTALPRIVSVRQNLRQAAMLPQQMGEVSLEGFQSGAFCQKHIELSARKHIGLSDRKVFLTRLTYPICQTVADVQK